MQRYSWTDEGMEAFPDGAYVYHDDAADLLEAQAALIAEAIELLRDAEYDLAQWVECSEWLVRDGYNMDGTPELAARIGAFIVKLHKVSPDPVPHDRRSPMEHERG